MCVNMKGNFMNINEAAKLFKLLGDENRVKIVQYLNRGGEVCACKLLDLVECKQATLSHHMNAMVESKIVNARKDGKWVHYSINKERMDELLSFIKPIHCCCCEE